MRRLLATILAVTVTLFFASCQPVPVSVTPVVAPPTPEQLAALEYLHEQQASFQRSVQDLLQKHLTTYRWRGGGGTVGIYFSELTSGISAGNEAGRTMQVNEESIGFFNTASVAKLPMAFVAFALHDQGVINLDEAHYDEVTRRTWDLRPMIRDMLTNSINDYFNILLRMIGPELAKATLALSGMPHTRLSRELQPGVGASDANDLKKYGTLLAPRTTPADLGHLLTGLYNGSLLSTESNAAMLDALENTIYNTRLPAGVGEGIVVAHKTGTSPEERIYNDAALILLPENPYVLVVLSKGASSHVTRTMRELSADLFVLEQSRVRDGMIASLREAMALVHQEPAPANKRETPVPQSVSPPSSVISEN